eukprot:TRINITY_DN191_c1_g1_i1.p1 TRINITY_DN191_c1_g1~~TRINITY_DN191_c1_g1_i1.p1  ORF type:complete len:237 (+),score=30.72 TRINITY_DN191_c1_g1_i1:217-927(+)
MKTFLIFSLFFIQTAADDKKKSDNPSFDNDQVSEIIASYLPKFVQRVACCKLKTDLNSLAMLQAEHLVVVAVDAMLTYGELKGWEYVIDQDMESVQIPKFLLDTTLKNALYFRRMDLFDLDTEDSEGTSESIRREKNPGDESFTIHELASDFVTTVTTMLQVAFQKIDEQIYLSLSNESLVTIIAQVETSLEQGVFDSEGFSFDFMFSQEYLKRIAQILLNQATVVTCEYQTPSFF